MSNAMFYVWLLLGSFTLMTVLFFVAEAEVKRLRRKMAQDEEDTKFNQAHERITNEVQILRRDMMDLHRGMQEEVDSMWREIHNTNQKLKEKTAKVR